MKKVFLLLVVALVATCSSFAQEPQNIIGISPIRLWNGLRIKYERVFTEKITIGGILTGYYGTFPGVQLAPIGRYYFKGTAPEGFYGQAKLVAGMYAPKYIADYNLGDTEKRYTFFSIGIGANIGYQLLWGGNNQWSIDMNLGIKYHPYFMPNNADFVNVVGAAVWNTTGPGSWVDGLISVGYRF